MQNITKVINLFMQRIGPGKDYKDITSFVRLSKIPMSLETVRRFLTEGLTITYPSLILMAKYLNYTPNEIKSFLEMTGDIEFVTLIGDHTFQLTKQEQALLEIWRLLKSKSVVTDQLELVAKMDRVDISKLLPKIRKGQGQ